MTLVPQPNQRLTTMNHKQSNSDDNDDETDKKQSTGPGISFPCQILNIGVLLTPPPTRQHTPTSSPLSSSLPICTKPRLETIPDWVIVLLQIFITVPLYIFSFWL